MEEQMIFIWGIMIVFSAIGFKWCLKHYSRKADAGLSFHLLGFALLSSMAATVINLTLGKSLHTIWVGRLVLLLVGVLHATLLYRRAFAKRDFTRYETDSLVPEMVFSILVAHLCSLSYQLSPRLLDFFNIATVYPDSAYWDAPLVLLLPFLVVKLFDLTGQVPFRIVENMWFYPIESIDARDWPRRDLINVNFSIASSLREEYRIFGRKVNQWIEVPREATLGNIFRLLQQERRKEQGRTTIQDIGTEYDGEPQFWWLFKKKFVWWKPSTWGVGIRYLNPDLSISANKITNEDIITAFRIPASKDQIPSGKPWINESGNDSDKTSILYR